MPGRPDRKTLLAATLLLSAACARELDLPPPRATTGTVIGRAVAEVPGTDQVEAVSGAVISIPGTNLHGISDAQGGFSVGPLPAGTYKVLVELRGDADKARQRLLEGVAVDPGGTKTLGDVSLRRNAVVTGRALIGGQARGNQGITIFVPGTDFVSATADTGAWRLSNLPEGPVSVGAFRPGFTAAFTAPINAQGGLQTTVVDLVIDQVPETPQPAAITGTVGVVGGFLADVKVAAWRAGSSAPVAQASPGTDGKFVLQNLPVDLYRLEATLQGFVPVVVPNLLVTSGASLHLPDPLLLIAPGANNVTPPPPFDAGTPPPVDAGTPDAGADAGTPDAGSVGAECNTDNDCASGRLCVSGRCVGCASNADCRPGYLCQGRDCVRACQSNTECAQGQVCTAGVCGACVTSADCGSPALVCLSGSCGHCRGSGDCAAGKACLASGCGDCSADADCGAGQLCMGGVCKAGTCRDATGCAPTQRCDVQTLSCAGCTADGQCAQGRLCLAGACQVADCRSNADCAGGKACLNNLCGACSGSGQCGQNQVCSGGACIPGTCNTTADCTGGQICVSHFCSPCTAKADCGAGQVCASGACVAGDCSSNADCTGGTICKSNHCQVCSVSADCGQSGLVCDSGACVTGDCTARADCTGPNAGKVCKADHCTLCAATADCAAGEVCSLAGLCVFGDCAANADCAGAKAGEVCTGNVCAPCTGDPQCGAGKLCVGSGAAARCAAATCHGNADCPTSQACVANFCAPCSATPDCRAGQVCSGHACVAGNCLAEADCAAGQLCTSNQCSACNGNASCGAGRVCASGLCKPGNCVNALTDCAPGQICSGNLCGSCSVKTDCAASGYVCDAGACVAGACVTAGDCPTAGQLCTGHQCVGCGSTADCGAGRVCASGLCKAGNCTSAAGCSGGQICVNNNCTPCQSATDCAASGYVCANGGCTPGDCVQTSDCSGGQVCNTGTHLCVNCTGNSDCKAGLEVCAAGRCVVGNCLAPADCQTAGSYNGKACLSNLCSLCTADNQCPAGDLCYAGTCAPGNCKTNNDCSGGQRLCAANGSGGKTCQPCGPSGAQGGCASGYLCDANGFCQFGSCVSAANCTGGKVCNGYQCQTCTAQTESLCPANTPICNTTTGACVAGNCHQDADCTAPNYTGGNGVCVGYTCTGNCRSNADCNAAGASPYCNPATHQCSPCTASNQCGAGSVCTSASGGACVAGSCSFDLGCNASAGMSCVNNQCTQTAPGVGATLPGGGSPVSTAETYPPINNFSSVLSGNLGLYYSWSPGTGYQTQTALDAADLKHVRWRQSEGTNGRVDFPGFVMNAPGYPGGELFITSDYYNLYAHLGIDGTIAWRNQTGMQYYGALGIAGAGAAGVPTMAFYQQGSPFAGVLVRADGLSTRLVTISSCSHQGPPTWGRYYLYYFCAEGIEAVDPVAGVVQWKLPFPGGNAGAPATAPAIWRPKNATQETLYFAATVAGTTREWMLTVTDAQTAAKIAPAGYAQGPVVTTAGYNAYSATLLDANDLAGSAPPRVVFATNGNPAAVSVTDGVGTLIAQVNTPFTSNKIMLASDGSIVGINGATASNGLLTGIRITPNASVATSAQVATLWSLPLSPAGQWQTFGYPTAVSTPGTTIGSLLDFGQPGGQATPSAYEMLPGSGAASFLTTAPAWSWYGGDSGGRRMAGGTECSADVDCGGVGSTLSCILGRCVGACRTAADCPAGQGYGCVLGQCEACVADVSCDVSRSQRCVAGVCYDPPQSGASCSKNSDCAANQFCVHAACVPATAPSGKSGNPLTTGSGFGLTVDTHRNVYSFAPTPGTLLVNAWDPATLDGVIAPLAGFSQVSIPLSVTSSPPVPVILSLHPDRDTLFFASYQSPAIVSFDGPPVGTGGATTVTRTAFDGRSNGTTFLMAAPAQGVSVAKDGSTPRPTFFSYTNGIIFALDAQDAASGSGNLTEVWSALTGGSDSSNVQPIPLLVGSDGTVYHFRTNGSIQAWHPDGDLTATGAPVNGTRAGRLLWTWNAPTPWSGNTGTRPAIAQVNGQDTLYFCTSVAGTLALLDVSAGGAANYTQTTAPCGSTNLFAATLVDTDGYALLASSSGLSLVAPRDVAGGPSRGAVVSQLGLGVAIDGANVTLGEDGIAYLVGPNSVGYPVMAVQIPPSKQLSVLYQALGPGNAPMDQSSFPILVPGPAGQPGHLLLDYPVSGSRYLLGFSLGTTHGPKPGAWSMWTQDFQHRGSLKPQ